MKILTVKSYQQTSITAVLSSMSILEIVGQAKTAKIRLRQSISIFQRLDTNKTNHYSIIWIKEDSITSTIGAVALTYPCKASTHDKFNQHLISKLSL